MTDINSVTLVGRLTRDPELKHLNTGTAVLNFSIAVGKSKKNSNGEWDTVTGFYDIAYFGKGAEAVDRYLTKGKQVAVLGSLDWSSWESEGKRRTKVSVVANSVQLLGDKSEGSGGGSNDVASNKEAEKKVMEVLGAENFQSDIPF